MMNIKRFKHIARKYKQTPVKPVLTKTSDSDYRLRNEIIELKPKFSRKQKIDLFDQQYPDNHENNFAN